MHRRDFLKLVALAGVGSAARAEALAAAVAGGAAAPVLGINTHLLTPEAIAQLRDLGLTHVRTTVYWPRWTEEPVYRAACRENFGRAEDAGLRVLAVCHNLWPFEVFHARADRREWDRFADWMAELARTFPSVEAWELWNEQDVWVQAPFGTGEGEDAATCGHNYAEQLRLAYPRIKEANRRAVVVSGGTADHPDERWRGFLHGMMESRPPVDSVAVHAYGPWQRARGIVAEAAGIVDGHAPIWLTECGNDRPDRFRADRQEEIWSSVIRGNERERLAARVYPYCLQTDPRDPGHGLFEVNGRPRPAYRWLRSHRRADAR